MPMLRINLLENELSKPPRRAETEFEDEDIKVLKEQFEKSTRGIKVMFGIVGVLVVLYVVMGTVKPVADYAERLLGVDLYLLEDTEEIEYQNKLQAQRLKASVYHSNAIKVHYRYIESLSVLFSAESESQNVLFSLISLNQNSVSLEAYGISKSSLAGFYDKITESVKQVDTISMSDVVRHAIGSRGLKQKTVISYELKPIDDDTSVIAPLVLLEPDSIIELTKALVESKDVKLESTVGDPKDSELFELIPIDFKMKAGKGEMADILSAFIGKELNLELRQVTISFDYPRGKDEELTMIINCNAFRLKPIPRPN